MLKMFPIKYDDENMRDKQVARKEMGKMKLEILGTSGGKSGQNCGGRTEWQYMGCAIGHAPRCC